MKEGAAALKPESAFVSLWTASKTRFLFDPPLFQADPSVILLRLATQLSSPLPDVHPFKIGSRICS
jgi:hypothetical protein